MPLMKSSRVRLPRFYRNSCEFILRSIPDTGNWISRTDRRPTSEWRIFTGQWIKWRRSCIGTVGNCSRAGSLELFSFRLILLYTVNNGNALVSRGLKHSLKGLLLSFLARPVAATKSLDTLSSSYDCECCNVARHERAYARLYREVWR
jgi:hypothetical protein